MSKSNLSVKEKALAWDDLLKLKGLPPYVENNPCYADGLFAGSIEKKFQQSVSELTKEIGFDKAQDKFKCAQALATTTLINPYADK